eukprot:1049777-Pyramimonas_sp.AAC.2
MTILSSSPPFGLQWAQVSHAYKTHSQLVRRTYLQLTSDAYTCTPVTRPASAHPQPCVSRMFAPARNPTWRLAPHSAASSTRPPPQLPHAACRRIRIPRRA